MKLTSLLLLILLLTILSSFVSCNLRRMREDKNKDEEAPHKKKLLSDINQQTVYFKFIEAIIKQLKGNKKDIETCMPGEWKKPKDETVVNPSYNTFESAKELFIMVEKALSKDVDVTCRYKDKVKDFFKKKVLVRRYSRVFVELEKVNGETNPLDKLSAKTAEIKQKFNEIYDLPIMKKVNVFLTCLKTARKSAGVGLINTVKSYIANSKSFAKGPVDGFIDVWVELICSWHTLKAALIFYENAITAKDISVKWENLGNFVGKMIYGIAMTPSAKKPQK